jgi:hypothetical protein
MAKLICESCLEAADEEVSPDISSVREMTQFLVDMGADIADHLCDQIESDGDIQCVCACHPHKMRLQRKSAYWSGKAKALTPDVIAETYRKLWTTPTHNYLGRDGKPLVG